LALALRARFARPNWQSCQFVNRSATSPQLRIRHGGAPAHCALTGRRIQQSVIEFRITAANFDLGAVIIANPTVPVWSD
jgi:hypothetical protein